MTYILVVADEPLVADSVCYSLRRAGYDLSLARDGHEALRLAVGRRPDLVVLDLRLPDLDATDVCRRLRATNPVPVLILAADEASRGRALAAGADDCLDKPFSFRELQARVRATLRRRALAHLGPRRATEVVRIGQLCLDRAAHRLTRAGVQVSLTTREYALLEALMDQAGCALPRVELLAMVWGQTWRGDPRTLDVHVRWLRTKIEDDPGAPRYLQTVRGVGYRFATAEELAAEA